MSAPPNDSPLGPLLALDTSTPTARVAVLSAAGDVLAQDERTADRHAAHLLGMVDDTLTGAGLTVHDLVAVAAGAGPGSFTGLRVGLALVKGLALAASARGDALAVVLVSSLEALAADVLGAPGLAGVAPDASGCVVCLDAGKGELYAQAFTRDADGYPTTATSAPTAEAGFAGWRLAPAALSERVRELPGPVAGPGADRHPELMASLGAAFHPGVRGPTARAVAVLARRRLHRGERDDWATAVPLYGRPPDITRPRNPPR